MIHDALLTCEVTDQYSLKMETAISSETWVTTYHSTRRHISEE